MHTFAAVSAVVFDFDGTLAHLTIDFGRMRRDVLALLPAHGLEPADFERLYVLELIEAAGRRLGATGADAEAFRAAARAAIERVEIEAAAAGGLLPGAAAALETLDRRGFRLGIVTRNCAAAVSAVLGGPAGGRLPHRVLLTRDDVPRVKPDPAHLEAALAALGVPASEAVMVGDHPMDVEAGRRAGMRTIGVLTGRSPRRDVEAARPDLVVDDVTRLPAVLPGRAVRN
ncbi:MAG TPA: HAD family hydrolase [Thermodesulfobacteriota bacterium]